MISVPPGTRVMMASEPVDGRKGMDTLAAVVQRHLHADPFAGTIYVFRTRKADRLKILVWDGTGLCLFQKRLEQGHFVWPPIRQGAISLTSVQLALLLEGLEWNRVRQVSVKRPETAY
jgi:transposase